MNKKPTVMISSTFYDLRQVRADLAPFFSDDLGFDVLLSETPSFPVEPDVDTVQNCTRRVEQHADILVLLIGGRYGFVDGATSRSVTNLEYLTARAKGIPVYAFVEKQVLACYLSTKRTRAVGLPLSLTMSEFSTSSFRFEKSTAIGASSSKSPRTSSKLSGSSSRSSPTEAWSRNVS